MEQFDSFCFYYDVGWALAQHGMARIKSMLGQVILPKKTDTLPSYHFDFKYPPDLT
jgi:hypothetical protein